ncbi:hypothetical protein AOLI_G00105850 [Acnodon oligacanthus]
MVLLAKHNAYGVSAEAANDRLTFCSLRAKKRPPAASRENQCGGLQQEKVQVDSGITGISCAPKPRLG